jgi:hypothetical protein
MGGGTLEFGGGGGGGKSESEREREGCKKFPSKYIYKFS